MNFNQRKGLLYRKNRFYFLILIMSIALISFFLFKTISLYNTYGHFSIHETYTITSIFAIWFLQLFFLLKNWEDLRFSGFLKRINRELSEVIKGERKSIFFRKKDTIKTNDLKDILLMKLHYNRQLERDYLHFKDQLKSNIKNDNEKEFKNTLIKIKEYIDQLS